MKGRKYRSNVRLNHYKPTKFAQQLVNDQIEYEKDVKTGIKKMNKVLDKEIIMK